MWRAQVPGAAAPPPPLSTPVVARGPRRIKGAIAPRPARACARALARTLGAVRRCSGTVAALCSRRRRRRISASARGGGRLGACDGRRACAAVGEQRAADCLGDLVALVHVRRHLGGVDLAQRAGPGLLLIEVDLELACCALAFVDHRRLRRAQQLSRGGVLRALGTAAPRGVRGVACASRARRGHLQPLSAWLVGVAVRRCSGADGSWPWQPLRGRSVAVICRTWWEGGV